jgi:hypothetical protein
MLKTEIAYVDNRRDPDRPWVLRWQTEKMAAPAFWYFVSREKARQEARNLYTQRREPFPADWDA